MSLTDNNIQDFTQQILKIQDENKQKILSTEQLKELAMSIGVSELEWNEMLKIADNKAVLAQNHLNLNNFEDAFNEAVASVSINPNHIKAYLVASEAGIKLFENNSDSFFIQKAEYYADEVLRRNPNDAKALKLLSQIRGSINTKKSRSKKIIIYGVAGIAAVALIIGLIFLLQSIPKKPNQNIKNQLIEAQENALSQWAQVQNVINRRNQLLPQLLSVINSDDENVAKIQQDLNDLQAKIDKASEQEKITLQFQIQQKFVELTKLVASQNNTEEVKLVLVQIEGTYNRIAVESKRYNDFVRDYNILVKKYKSDFPEFIEMQYFEGN